MQGLQTSLRAIKHSLKMYTFSDTPKRHNSAAYTKMLFFYFIGFTCFVSVTADMYDFQEYASIDFVYTMYPQNRLSVK